MHKVHVHDEFTLKSLKLIKVTEGKVMLLMTDNHEKCIWGAYRAFPFRTANVFDKSEEDQNDNVLTLRTLPSLLAFSKGENPTLLSKQDRISVRVNFYSCGGCG